MESPKHKKNDKSSEHKDENKSYLRFYGIALETVAFNLICTWGGLKLSELYSPNSNWILFTSIPLALAGTIYLLLKRTKE